MKVDSVKSKKKQASGNRLEGHDDVDVNVVAVGRQVKLTGLSETFSFDRTELRPDMSIRVESRLCWETITKNIGHFYTWTTEHKKCISWAIK